MITQFKGEYRWLSNFAPVTLKFDGIIFPSVEHAYVASKTGDEEVKKYISTIPSAGEAKKFGRTLYIRPIVEASKVVTMQFLIGCKFDIEPYKQLLLNTGSEEIVEGNYWHDNFWGDCYCKKCVPLIGHNTLGKIIMMKRDKI